MFYTLDLRDFSRLTTAFDRGFERSANLYYRFLQFINKLKKKNNNNIKLPVVKPPLNFPDLTGWGV